MLRLYVLFMGARIMFYDPGAFLYVGRLENVVFTHDDVRLSGVLVRPYGRGPFPAVILVHGSGPATHNEVAYRIYANAFLRKGLAALVCDKRGSGNSTGDLRLATYEDLAEDVAAGMRFLRTRSDIIPDQIGLFGRSEGGGWVGPLAAARVGHVAFFVDGVGPAVTQAEQMVYAIALALRKHGYGERDIQQALSLRRALCEYYRRAAIDSVWAVGAARDSLARAIAVAQQSTWYRTAEDLPQSLPAYDRKWYSALAFNYFFDPAPVMARLDCPVLAVLAKEDERVPTDATVAVLEKLRSERNRTLVICVFPRVGHTFMTWRALPPPFPPGYLSLLGNWAKQQVSSIR